MRIAAMLLFLAGLAAATPTAAAPPPSAGSPCARIEVRADSDLTGSRDRVFSAASVKDLAFVVTLSPGLAAAELLVRTPNGHAYQRLQARQDLATDASRKPIVRLPVSGTLIVNSSLYGEWQVEPRLPGGPAACGASERFTIVP